MEEEWQTATSGRRRRKGGGGAAASGERGSSVDYAGNAPAVSHVSIGRHSAHVLHALTCVLASAGQHHGGSSPAPRIQGSSQPPTERQLQRWCDAVAAAATELAASPFWERLAEQLAQLPGHCGTSEISCMVMYGLGSLEQPGAVHIRYQLALAGLLSAAAAAAAAAEAFDPVFTPLDRAVLSRRGIQVRLLHQIAACSACRQCGQSVLPRQPVCAQVPHLVC